MPARLFILTLLLALTMATTAWARLGETQAAVIARYGKPSFRLLRTWCEEDTFQFNGFNIVVTLINGVSKGENYSIPGQLLTEQQANDLLAANSEGFMWDEVPKADVVPPAKRMWKKPNGTIAMMSGSNFDVKTMDLIKAQEQAAAKQKPAGPSTEGF